MSWQGKVVAVVISLAAGSSVASVMQTSQVLDFQFPTTEYRQYAPLTPQNMAEMTHTQKMSLHFTGFDDSLGTLKDAFLSYRDSYAIEYVTVAGTRPPYWYESVVYGGNVAGVAYYHYDFGLTADGVSGSIGKVLHRETMTTPVSGSRYSGILYINMDGSGPKDPDGDTSIDGSYLREPWVVSGDLSIPLLSLADGLDLSGNGVDVMLTKAITLYMAPFFSSFVDPDYSYVDNYLNPWSGKLSLTYIYEADGPGPIPEPGGLLLVGTALVALAWSRSTTAGRDKGGSGA